MPQSGKKGRVLKKSNMNLKYFHFSFSAHRNCWRRRKLENRAKVFFRCEYAYCQHLISEDADYLFNHECLLLRQICGWRFYKDWFSCTELLPHEEDDVSDYTFTHTDALNFLLTKYLRQLGPSLHQKFPSLDSIVFEDEPQQVEQLPLVKQFKLEATPVIHESRYVSTA